MTVVQGKKCYLWNRKNCDMSRYILFVLAVFFHSFLIGQNKFHRGYPFKESFGTDPDTSIVNLSGLQMKDGTFLSLDGVRAVNDTAYRYLVLTTYKPKGDIGISRQYAMQDNAGILHGNVSLFQAKNDSVYISFTTNGSKNKRVMVGFGKDIRAAWSVAFNGDADDKAIRRGHFLNEGYDSLLYELVQLDKTDSSLWYVNRLNTKGGVQQANKYKYSRTNGSVLQAEALDFRTTLDTGWVWSGHIQRTATGNSAMLVKLDENLDPVLGKTYLPNGFQQAEGLKVLQVGNTYLVAGRMGNALNAMDQSFILQADSKGKILWSKKTDDKVSKKNVIDGLIQDKDGRFIVSGKMVIRDTTETPFLLKLREDGTQQWLVLYDRAKAHFNLQGSLFETGDNGYGYYQTDVDDEQTGKLKMGFIKTNDMGVSTCETPDSSILFINHAFTTDTVLVQRNITVDTTAEVKLRTEGFDGFEVPVLIMLDKKYCPNEPINELLEAKPIGAVAWLWSDGSTKDTLRVFSTGEYSVTVTIDDKYCFMLCDTSTLDYYDQPSPFMALGPQVCINTPYEIAAAVQGGKTPYTYSWSDGTTLPRINPNKTGTFSVTVTDACGQTARATINVGTEIWLGPPSVGIALGPMVCENTPFILSASAAGGGGSYTYKWNTGETTPIISTNKLGNYEVTVTDNCGLTASVNIFVDKSIWLGPPSAGIVKGSPVCKDSEFILSAAGAGGGGNYTYKWSSGQTTAIISTKNLGDYVVTVTDNCGLTSSVSINVDASIWLPNPTAQIVKGPNVCKDTEFTLSGTGQGGGGSYRYKWNNNDTTNVIRPKLLGTYVLTVTDNCNNTATAAVVVDASIWLAAPTVEIKPSEQNSFCRTGKIGLSAEAFAFGGGNEIVSYAWSAGGSTSSEALVEEEGKYSVTVTDACNQTGSDDYDTGKLGIACLRFPKIVFATDSAQAENKLFRAINQCGVDSAEVRNFEMHVFDRWGKEVFSSTNIEDGWDARIPNGSGSSGSRERYPPEVYVWYVRYDVGEFCRYEGKGDVTIFW